MKKIIGWLAFLAGVLFVWQMVALLVHNPVIAPSVPEVAQQMWLQLTGKHFWPAVSATLFRTVLSVILSFVLGVGLALAAFFIPLVSSLCSRCVSLLQAIPNVAYIILILFWLPRNGAVIVVQLFLLFPLVYRDFYEAFLSIQRKWKDIFQIYPQPWTRIAGKVYLPMLEATVAASLKSCFSLAFKAGVMAEILASVQVGIGRSLQSARLAVNVAGVIGWVIWLLLFVFLFEGLVRILIRRIFER